MPNPFDPACVAREDQGACPASPATALAPPSAVEPQEGLEQSRSSHGASVLLHYPKFIANLGAIARTAACFGAAPVWYTGERVDFAIDRLPRELRMRQFATTKPQRLFNFRRAIETAVVPVAVEILPHSEDLADFEHPEDALYIFGPEDGSLPPEILKLCHRFVTIPAGHCLSLPTAVALTLYDRARKLKSRGGEA